MNTKPLYQIDIDANGTIYLTPAEEGGSPHLAPERGDAISHAPRKRLKKVIATRRSSTNEDAQIEAFGKIFEEIGHVAFRINASLEQIHYTLTDMISNVRAVKSTGNPGM